MSRFDLRLCGVWPGVRRAGRQGRAQALTPGQRRCRRRLGFDGRIMSGWASIGQTSEESEKTMTSLIESEGLAYVHD
jgi:hypothetical protein